MTSSNWLSFSVSKAVPGLKVYVPSLLKESDPFATSSTSW